MEKKKSQKDSLYDDVFEIHDHDLEHTLERYLDSEEVKPEKPQLINFVTLSGFAFLIVGFLAVMQSIFSFGSQLDSLINVLPLIGGILVVLIGMGLFNSTKKKKSLTSSSKKEFNEMKLESKQKSSGLDDFAIKNSRKLTKSRYDSRFMGVCGGVARYLGFDSTLVRIAFIASVFFGYGTPILLYFALAVILPKEPKHPF